jgi:uncharacterized protein (TIGR02147 family)
MDMPMIFRYLSYKSFINDHFKAFPQGGRGQAKKLSEYLGVSTVVVSQTLKGEREFSAENAYRVAQFLKLTPIETQYFLKLVDYQKAGSHELKAFILSELKHLQKEGKKVKSKYSKTLELSDEDKFQFYSEKYYSAIRMASSLPSHNTVEDFANHFHLSFEKTEEILDFLLNRNLCVNKNGKIERGPKHTFLPSTSPYIKNHHRNWRIHSLERVDHLDTENELMYTAPMSLSKDAFQKLRENLLQTIADTVKLIGPTEDEVVACLNIDLLKL